MVTSDPLLPMICLMSSRADLTLKSQCVMSSAPADELDTQLFLNIRDPHRSLTVSGAAVPEILLGTCCSVVLDCSSLASCGSLFVGCPSTVLVCTVSPHRDIATNVFLAACFESRPGWGRCSGQCFVVMLGCAPDADDPPYETEGCGVEPCSVPIAIFF